MSYKTRSNYALSVNITEDRLINLLKIEERK